MRTFIIMPKWTLRPVARCGIGAKLGRGTKEFLRPLLLLRLEE